MSKVYGVFEVYGDGDGIAVFDLIGVEMSESLAHALVDKAKSMLPAVPPGGVAHRNNIHIGVREGAPQNIDGRWGYVIEPIEIGEVLSR